MHHGIVAIGRTDRAGLTAEAKGIPTGLHSPRTAPQLIAEHADPAVGLRQMLEPVNGDRPLRNLRFEVARPPLSFLRGISSKLTRQHNLAISPPRRRDALGFADMP